MNLDTLSLPKIWFIVPSKIKKIITTDVFLKLSKAESYSNKITEIKLKYPSLEFFAKRQSNTFEESTTQVFHALRKQILKNKAKRQLITRLKLFSKKSVLLFG